MTDQHDYKPHNLGSGVKKMAIYKSFDVACHDEIPFSPKERGAEVITVPAGTVSDAILLASIEYTNVGYYTPISYLRSNDTISFIKDRVSYSVDDLTGEVKEECRIAFKVPRSRKLEL